MTAERLPAPHSAIESRAYLAPNWDRTRMVVALTLGDYRVRVIGCARPRCCGDPRAGRTGLSSSYEGESVKARNPKQEPDVLSHEQSIDDQQEPGPQADLPPPAAVHRSHPAASKS